MKKQTELKKVKIDDHIKATKGNNTKPVPGKRGRPRKNTDGNDGATKLQSTTGATSQPSLPKPIESNQNNPPNGGTAPITIQPIYDTTEEAKGFLRAPFDIVAGLTGVSKLALYPSQIDALAPSFKIVYDKRIAPHMGQNADLIAFGMVFAGIAFEKVQVFREEKKKLESDNKHAPVSTNENGAPIIPHEHHV